jgi:hypothetical protein
MCTWSLVQLHLITHNYTPVIGSDLHKAHSRQEMPVNSRLRSALTTGCAWEALRAPHQPMPPSSPMPAYYRCFRLPPTPTPTPDLTLTFLFLAPFSSTALRFNTLPLPHIGIGLEKHGAYIYSRAAARSVPHRGSNGALRPGVPRVARSTRARPPQPIHTHTHARARTHTHIQKSRPHAGVPLTFSSLASL